VAEGGRAEGDNVSSRQAVSLKTERLDQRFYCDTCGELRSGPHYAAAVARARRHAIHNPDHVVSTNYMVEATFIKRRATA
jgi:hypothetical protein